MTFRTKLDQLVNVKIAVETTKGTSKGILKEVGQDYIEIAEYDSDAPWTTFQMHQIVSFKKA